MLNNEDIQAVKMDLDDTKFSPNHGKLYWWWSDLWTYTFPFCKIRDLYYDIRNLLFRRYDLIRTGLSKTDWWDKDTLILHGMMNLLVDYVEKEKCFESIDWESDKDHSDTAKEIRVIYDWWKDYNNRCKAIDDQRDVWHEEFKKRTGDGFDYNFIYKLNTTTASNKEQIESDKLEKMENDLLNEEQDMLIRLIKIRKYLWT